jgi:broad specificity phosphatase PhoE
VAQDGTTTVFVVRHAEKGPATPDPSLTEAGNVRARALAHSLRDQKVSAIFSSEFKRTQETAAPLGQELGITTTVIGAAKTDDLVTALKALPPGSRALVVSHSNLVPVIVEKLSGQKVGELTDSDYDRLYVVILRTNAAASVLYLHYGAPSAAGTASMRP